MRATITFAMLLLTTSSAFADWPWHRHKMQSGSVAALPGTAVPAADPSGPMVPGPPYLIGLGDVLRVSVWREPELTSTVQVRSDGNISIPLLNDVQVVGVTPIDLAASLTEKLKKYVDDPHVTVIVSQAKPRTIYMVGEVGVHGPMPLLPNMTVLQALISAGMTTFANTKKIYVLRIENGVEQKMRVNYKKLVKGENLDQNIVLKPGDMIVVP